MLLSKIKLGSKCHLRADSDLTRRDSDDAQNDLYLSRACNDSIVWREDHGPLNKKDNTLKKQLNTLESLESLTQYA